MQQLKHIIVYAEDDYDDLQFVRDCFEKYDDRIELLHVPNGNDAVHTIDELHRKGMSPCLIILDINMPLMDGRQALVKLKNNAALKKLPVVMFTTSSSHLDRDFAAKWGADFVTKPLRYAEVASLADEFIRRCDGEMKARA